MAKKLMINCGNCDARNVKEETLKAYETITINCGGVLVSPESKDLLNRYNVTMNCGNVIEVPKDVRVARINGSAQIKSTDLVQDRQYLIINGSLEIGPDTEMVLDQYVGINVNGSVTYPESISGFLGMMTVNGSTLCYPDGAVVLKRNAVIDRLFALRAKNRLYWSAKRMIMVDPQLDGSLLAKKGASFATKEVILAEGKVEEMIDLIDEKAEITIVPAGTSYVMDFEELNEQLIKKYGTKIYILGDLRVMGDAAEALGKLEYLKVQGDITVQESLKASLLEVLTEHNGSLKTVAAPKGCHISDKITLRISKWLLEQEAGGISVSDCVKVVLDEDISSQLILDRLQFHDVVEIRCTPEQEAAVGAVAEDVMSIGKGVRMTKVEGDGEMVQESQIDELGIGDMIKGAFGVAKNLLDTKVINAGDYVL